MGRCILGGRGHRANFGLPWGGNGKDHVAIGGTEEGKKAEHKVNPKKKTHNLQMTGCNIGGNCNYVKRGPGMEFGPPKRGLRLD